jgi:formamidopyrimidine-DNA glycosylase
VEKAVGLINTVAAGKRIEKVEAIEDNIVFSGTTHDDFVRETPNLCQTSTLI